MFAFLGVKTYAHYHKKYISSLSKKEQEYSDYVKQQQELITEIHHYLILAQRKIREL